MIFVQDSRPLWLHPASIVPAGSSKSIPVRDTANTIGASKLTDDSKDSLRIDGAREVGVYVVNVIVPETIRYYVEYVGAGDHRSGELSEDEGLLLDLTRTAVMGP